MSATNCPTCGVVKTKENCSYRSGLRSHQFRGHCNKCSAERGRVYRKKYPEKVRIARALYYQNNRIAIIAGKQSWQAAHPDYQRESHLKRTFGITLSYYNKLLKEQGGVCAVCKQPEIVRIPRTGKLRQLHVDHCHTTKKVRGLLCTNCNIGLGCLQDDPKVIQSLLEYLQRVIK